MKLHEFKYIEFTVVGLPLPLSGAGPLPGAGPDHGQQPPRYSPVHGHVTGLGEGSGVSFFSSDETLGQNLRFGEAVRDFVIAIIAAGDPMGGRDSVQVSYDGRHYRLTKVVTVEGSVFVVRPLADLAWDYKSLRIPAQVLVHMLKTALASRQGGLGLIAGRPRQGKTTTGCSVTTMIAQYSSEAIWTIESPAEFAMNGPGPQHPGTGGRGYIHQIEVDDNESMASTMRTLLRTSPHFVYVGEFRTKELVDSALRLVAQGAFVIGTTFGGSLQDALSHFHTMADEELREIFATRLVWCLHQSLPLPSEPPRIVYIHNDNGSHTNVVNAIRTNQMNGIHAIAERQLNDLVIAVGSASSRAKSE